MWKPGKFSLCILLIQAILIILFILFVHYGRDAHAADPQNSQSVGMGGTDPLDNPIKDYYSMLRDVHVMLYVGFALFIAGSKQYSFSALGLNMLLTGMAIQISLLVCNISDIVENGKTEIDIRSLIQAEFISLSVVVSFGAVLGRLSPLQLLFMSVFEVSLCAFNHHFAKAYLKVHDVGGSIFLHTFGAYFGLSVSYMILNADNRDRPNEDNSKNANLFPAIGSVILFALWPSFNSVLTTGDDRHRAVINTFLALTSSCVSSIAFSSLLDTKNKLSIVYIRNGTLAGGVGIGACADMMTQPYGAMMIGSCCALVSIITQKFVGPLLSQRMKLLDANGVNYVHGIPGVLGGLISVFMTAIASEESYGKSLYEQFPARAPVENSTELYDVQAYMRHVRGGYGRSSATQTLFQAAAIAMTLVIAVSGGVVTGSIIRRQFFEHSEAENAFNDYHIWNGLNVYQPCETTDSANSRTASGNHV